MTTLTYKPTIKLYQSNGTTLDSSFFTGGVIPIWDKAPELNWSVYGGCVSGRLALCFKNAIREPFRVTRGQVVKVYQFVEDANPIWAGLVDEVSRSFDDDYHEVTLRGLWDLVDAEVDEDITVGSQATGAITVGGVPHDANEYDTVGKIVKLLLDKWAVPSSGGLISYEAGDVASTTPRALLRITQGTSIKRLLAELALTAESVNLGVDGEVVADPQRWSYGVDGAGKFFFKAIPGGVQNTLAFGATIIGGGTERPAGSVPAEQVIVSGAVRRDVGVKTKRTYRYTHGLTKGRTRAKMIRVTGSPYERDLAQAGAGWLSRYAAPPASVEGAIRVEAPAAAIPMPWTGRIRWQDGARLTIDSYASGVRAVLDRVPSWEADLGIGSESSEIDGGADPYAPSLLDLAMEGSDAAAGADDVWQEAECSEGIEGDMDYPGIDPPAGEPAFVGTDLLADVDGLQTDMAAADAELTDHEGRIAALEAGAGGAVTHSASLPAGAILSLNPPGGMKPGDVLRLTALISNGRSPGSLLEENTPVVFPYHFISDDGLTVLDGELYGERIAADDENGIEVWQSTTAQRVWIMGIPEDDPSICPNGVLAYAGQFNGKSAWRRERDSAWRLWYEGKVSNTYYWRLSQALGDITLSWRFATLAEDLAFALEQGAIVSVSTNGSVPVKDGSPAPATLAAVPASSKVSGDSTPVIAGTFPYVGEFSAAPCFGLTLGGTPYYLYYIKLASGTYAWCLSAYPGDDVDISTSPGWKYSNEDGLLHPNGYASGTPSLEDQFVPAGKFAVPGTVWVGAASYARDLSQMNELLSDTGWTTTGWTGDFNAGFSHAAGSTQALSHAVSIQAGKKYILGIKVNSRTAGAVTVSLAGRTAVVSKDGEYSFLVAAYNTNSLSITPTNDFAGTIGSLSIKEAPGVETEIQRFYPDDLSGTQQVQGVTNNLLAATGWTSAGWTGSFESGFINGSGNTQALAHALAGAAAGKRYQVALTISGRMAGSITLNVAGWSTTLLNGSFTLTALATAAAGFTLTPTADFDGTVSFMQVVESLDSEVSGYTNYKNGVPVRVLEGGGAGGTINCVGWVA